MKKITINMISAATSVEGQGVGSAFLEQTALVKENNDFEILINSKDKTPEIFHFHSVNFPFFFKMKNRHINVCYVHFIPTTLDGFIRLPKFAFWVFKKYVIRFYKNADEIVVVNPIFIPDLVKLGIKESAITYIPNFVSRDKFFKKENNEIDKLKEEYQIPKNKFVVLGAGQVQNRKGVKDFIEVAKKNKNQFFVWAGGFSFGRITDGYEELKKIVKNPPENVLFLGIIKREKMNDIYNIADVMFLPSYNELFPMTVLEAINLEKPILVRDLDLYKNVIFDNYISGSNNDQFAEQLCKLENDTAFYKKASELSNELASYYSKENVTKIWDKYYKDLITKYPDKTNVRGKKGL